MLWPVPRGLHHPRRRSQDALPMPARLLVQGSPTPSLSAQDRLPGMHAEEIADLCLKETGAGKISREARTVCYLAMMYSPTADMRVLQRRIKKSFRDSKKYGSFFLVFVLPLLISLISNWIIKWLWSSPTTTNQIKRMRVQAYASLIASSPGMTDTLTSIDFPET